MKKVTVNLTIDGQPIEVEPGTTILQAAGKLGIDIPTLCFVEGFEPVSSCFLCAVQVEGKPNLSPACAMLVAEGMVVSTQSDDVRGARRMALESQKREYPGAWVYTVLEGDGKEFDWGIDQVECGICKFFADQDAQEFVPYMCALDFIASDYFGWGLVRTTTLAEGGERCDFRFKRVAKDQNSQLEGGAE